MSDKERKSCINTIESLRRLALNVHGVMDVIDAQNCDEIIKMLEKQEPQIIRCKDCKHGVDYYHEGDCYCSNPKWGLMYFGGSWEFYCGGAERRTDEDN